MIQAYPSPSSLPLPLPLKKSQRPRVSERLGHLLVEKTLPCHKIPACKHSTAVCTWLLRPAPNRCYKHFWKKRHQVSQLALESVTKLPRFFRVKAMQRQGAPLISTKGVPGGPDGFCRSFCNKWDAEKEFLFAVESDVYST